MKKFEGDRYVLEVLAEDSEKFSIFRITNGLYYNSSLREQDIEWFSNSGEEKYNQGMTKVWIEVNSEEEKYHLASLFFGQGFKVKFENQVWNTSNYRLKRRWFTPEELDINPYCLNSPLHPWANRLYVYLSRKSLKSFLDFVKVLSKDHKYYTIYNDYTCIRNFLRTRHNKMKYQLS